MSHSRQRPASETLHSNRCPGMSATTAAFLESSHAPTRHRHRICVAARHVEGLATRSPISTSPTPEDLTPISGLDAGAACHRAGIWASRPSAPPASVPAAARHVEGRGTASSGSRFTLERLAGLCWLVPEPGRPCDRAFRLRLCGQSVGAVVTRGTCNVADFAGAVRTSERSLASTSPTRRNRTWAHGDHRSARAAVLPSRPTVPSA